MFNITKPYFFGILVVFLLLMETLTGSASKTRPMEYDVPALEKEVNRLIIPLVKDDLVSGSILISHGGDIVFAKGYGFASREHNVPCTLETPFSIASITKAITAVAVMQLVERKLLDLDDPVVKWLPDYPTGHRITIRHLLTHTSGIPSSVFLPDHGALCKESRTLDEVIAEFRDQPLDFEPGSQYRYSNSGFTLLSKIIEVVTNSTYESYLTDNIFRPAGMERSGLDGRPLILPGRAYGYSCNETGNVVRPQYRDPTEGYGDGAVYSTVLDLYKFDLALSSGILLSSETQAEMTHAAIKTPWRDSYALGWFTGERRGHRVVQHPGASFGFMSSYQRFPDDNVAVIALLNRDFMLGEELFDRLAAIALDESWQPLFTESLSSDHQVKLTSFEGNYKMEPEGRLRFIADGELFFIQEEGHKREKVFPLSASRLYCKKLNALIRFEDGDNNHPPRLIGQYGIYRWVGTRISQ